MSFTSRLLLTASVAALWAPTAQAQQGDPVDGILACRNIVNVEARLACFDSAAVRLASARQGGDIVIVEREEIEAVERDSFGFNMPSLPSLRLPRLGSHDMPHDAMATAEPAVETPQAPASATAHAERPAPDPRPEDVRVTARDDSGAVDAVSIPIQSTRIVGYNTTIFQMANGQVWRQIDTRRVRMPRGDGHYAEIRRAAMGSYLLRINGEGAAIRVRRVQ